MEVVDVEEIRKMKKTDLKALIENFVKSDEKVCILDNVDVKSVRQIIYRKKYKIRISVRNNKIVLTKIGDRYGSH